MKLDTKTFLKQKRQIKNLIKNDRAKEWYLAYIVGRENYLGLPVAIYFATVRLWLGMLVYAVFALVKYALRLWVVWDFADVMITSAILKAEKKRKEDKRGKARSK